MSFPIIVNAGDLAKSLAQIESKGQALPDAHVCLVDLRPAEAYAQGHIPGAVNGNAALLNRSETPIGGLLPEPDAVNAFLREIGANMGDQIIAYDAGGQTAAARLLWVLDAYGYEVGSWLNGGFSAWMASELPISQTLENAEPGTLSLHPIADNLISVDALKEALGSESLKILDVRSIGEYSGQDIRSLRGGHVPGARHLEWTGQLNAQGEILSDTQLQNQLAALNIEQDDTVIVYCQTHQRSAVTYVILKHLGFTDVRALDGAWSNWGNRQDTPIETTG